MNDKTEKKDQEHRYKSSLNLPTTDFAMRANLPTRELEFIQYWDSINLYQRQREIFAEKPKFIFHDGPPYANGDLHIGHAVNKILKDIVTKSHSQLGFDAPFVPGWDCHGLPIELVVEKKYGKVGEKVDATTFRRHCREFALSQVNVQRQGFIRLGVLADFAKPYLTLDPKIEADIVRSLAKIVASGHLERGSRPVHWCLECGSSLAEAEVEYEDKQSSSIDVMFHLADEDDLAQRIGCLKGDGAISVVIWTTTPWTLPGNEAVSVNANETYVLAQCGQQRVIVAKALIASLEASWQLSLRICNEFKGQQIEQLQLIHPLYVTKQVPVILGSHVTLDAGTGCVHTAPAHGEDDYKVGLLYQLPLHNPVLGNGVYADNVPLLAGLHIRKAEALILSTLKESGHLLHDTKIVHSYPHCWRHKTPTIFRATPQWFVSMEKAGLRSQILAQIDGVKFTPEWGKARLQGMIANRGDWCISRQRYWGVPIPFFLHKKTGELHPDTAVLLEKVAMRIELEGLEGWFSAPVSDFITMDADQYEKNTDTLDVWFDSGTTHYSVLQRRSELGFPANLYLEGSDQHRGWFNSSITSSVAMNGVTPYTGLLTHGFTVDAQGRKMSKSLGNGVEPQAVIKTLGADILRLWVASCDYRGEIPVSDEILKRIADVYRRIRNTARFLLANINEFKPDEHAVSFEKMLPLDRWIVDRAWLLQNEFKVAYQDYQFHHIYQKLHHFCSIDLGSFYLDVIKDRQYTTATNSLARRSCQTALFHVLEAMVRWMAPILSFTAEEIWQSMRKMSTREDSVFLTTFYENLVVLAPEQTFNREYWDDILLVRTEVSKAIELLRNTGKVGSSLETQVILYVCEPLLSRLQCLEDELRFVLIASETIVKPLSQKPEYLVMNEVNQYQLAIEVIPSTGKKCVRCWHYRQDIGIDIEHPELCGRCVQNLHPEGESRRFA